MLKIGLLECDHIPEKFSNLAKDYSNLFQDLFPDYEFRLYDVCRGVFPKSTEECDAFMCTGSRYSVYDDMDWIARLKAFIKMLDEQKKPFVGVCFGHQLLGEALGGKVWKAPAGWNVGAHTFEMVQHGDWMSPSHQELNLLMMCQDQVMELPKHATIHAQTDDCKVGIFTVGDHMLGIQAHPEFTKAYNMALMLDRTMRIGEEKVEKGIESLKLPVHRDVIAKWIMNFLEKSK